VTSPLTRRHKQPAHYRVHTEVLFDDICVARRRSHAQGVGFNPIDARKSTVRTTRQLSITLPAESPEAAAQYMDSIVAFCEGLAPCRGFGRSAIDDEWSLHSPLSAQDVLIVGVQAVTGVMCPDLKNFFTPPLRFRITGHIAHDNRGNRQLVEGRMPSTSCRAIRHP
jgi:hypothetical protein